jgi:hypothetical protein
LAALIVLALAAHAEPWEWRSYPFGAGWNYYGTDRQRREWTAHGFTNGDTEYFGAVGPDGQRQHCERYPFGSGTVSRTFDAQFTPFISGNHKPALRNVDPAIKGRMHLVPFSVFIPENERDPQLLDKLKAAEGPEILQWLLDGCLLYQQHGLNPPQAVRDATGDYLQEQDWFSEWIERCCDLGKAFWEHSASLFQCWKLHSELANEPVGTARAFAQRLQALPGVRAKRNTKVKRGYEGIRLKPVPGPRPQP